jgi:hypothetical protein
MGEASQEQIGTRFNWTPLYCLIIAFSSSSYLELGPQPIPNTIAIQSFHEQLLELKAMLRDRILQNTSVWIAESSKLCKSDYLLGEEIDLDRFWDHCFNIRPESIFYHRLHKAASSQALYTSKSPKSTVFDTTKWQWLKPETEVSVSRIT